MFPDYSTDTAVLILSLDESVVLCVGCHGPSEAFIVFMKYFPKRPAGGTLSNARAGGVLAAVFTLCCAGAGVTYV